jgi:hypothetical protein
MAKTKSSSGGDTAKGKRIPTQPPGMPQGKHNIKAKDTCQCGRCTNDRLGKTFAGIK